MLVIYFILGSCLTSFVSAYAYRLVNDESIIKGRSHCEKCFHQLSFLDLIPIVSYLTLKGRCAYCKQKIAIKYPILETLGGFLAIFCFKRFFPHGLLAFLILLMFYVIALIDYQTMDIYLSTIIILAILVLIFSFQQGQDLVPLILEALIMPTFLIVMMLLIKGSWGFGDVELLFVSGILLGWKYNLTAFILGVFLASLVALILIFTNKIKMKDQMAFAPYLVIGILITWFFRVEILRLYLKLFF